MQKVAGFENTGAYDVMQVRDAPIPELKSQTDLLIKQTYIGVNDIDTRYRSGFFKLSEGFKVCGYEASGVIEKIGEKVTKFNVGDRIAYATAPIGSYGQYRVIDQRYAFKIPDDLDEKLFLSNFFKGLTGHYLTKRAFLTSDKVAVLVHDASNATAQAIVRFASDSGAAVIVTARDEKKASFLEKMGCKYIFLLSEDWSTKVLDLSNKFGITAVYDSVGQETLEGSIKCLMKMGMYINYDESSGRLPMLSPSLFGSKSLFFTKTSLFHYKAHYMEFLLSAQDICERIRSGLLDISTLEMGMSEVALAHQKLDLFENTKSIIMQPSV